MAWADPNASEFVFNPSASEYSYEPDPMANQDDVNQYEYDDYGMEGQGVDPNVCYDQFGKMYTYNPQDGFCYDADGLKYLYN